MNSKAAAADSGQKAIDPKELRGALGCFGTGVTIVTTRNGSGQPMGLTVNSFNSVSLDPPLVLWSLSLDSESLSAFQAANSFAVNILAADQSDLSNRFAARIPSKFDGVPLRESGTGPPLLEGCAAWFTCGKEATHPGGDHIIIIGRITHFERTERQPLLYCAGQYMVGQPLDPA